MIEGEWADNKKIELLDWDEETVTRLLDWLYLADYAVPSPKSTCLPNSDDTEKLSVLQASDRPDKSAEFEKYADVCEQFGKHKISYSAIVMAHTKLYVMANYMLLPRLQQVAFRHLKSILLFLGVLEAGTPPIADLVMVTRYVYANTAAFINSDEPLRRLFTSFIAINFFVFKGREVDELIEEGGDFAVDLAAEVREEFQETVKSTTTFTSRTKPWSTKLDGRFKNLDAFSAR